MKTRTLFLASLALVSTLNSQLSTAFAQGSLTPPDAPAPTMKSLDQIEPRTPISSLPFAITSAGSYYLTTNLTLDIINTSGIVISADDVVVDLNGFALRGPGSGAGGTAAGILGSGPRHNLAIRNGVVRNWGGTGIELFDAGSNCQMERIFAYGNGGYGIASGGGSVVRDCTSEANASQGIRVANGSTVRGCTARLNGGFGFRLINDCVLQSSVSSSNTSHGVPTGANCTIKDCSVANNKGYGIVAGKVCTIKDCTVAANGTIPAAVMAGIQADSRSTISGCTVSDSVWYGILVTDHCLVVGNNVSLSLQSGIYTAGTHNRIDGNTVTFNTKGIEVVGTLNAITRNSASDNSGNNYPIVGGNQVGPSGVPASATSPWANISF